MEQIKDSTIKSIVKGTMFNISKYVQNVVSEACRKAFPLEKNFTAQINWNTTSSSDSLLSSGYENL